MAIEINGKVYRNLQEQVGKNQEDIELLKQRPAMHTEVVEELPEVGEEGIIYLIAKEDTGDSDIYNEYVWTGEAFEFIGNTSADISNMVTTDTDQEITGVKTFKGATSTTLPIVFANDYSSSTFAMGKNNDWFYIRDTGVRLAMNSGQTILYQKLYPNVSNTYDLGQSGNTWKDLYLGGKACLGSTNEYLSADSNYLSIFQGGNRRMALGASVYCYQDFLPGSNGIKNLGSSSMQWKDAYLSGKVNISGENYDGYISNESNRLTFYYGGATRFQVGNSDATFAVSYIRANADNNSDIGQSNRRWKDLYLSGNLSDGTNSVTVADIAAGLGTPTLTASASGTVVTIDVPQNILPDYIELSVSLSGSSTLVRIYKTMSSSGISYSTSSPCHMNARLGATTPTYIELDFDQDDSVSSPTIAGFTYSHMKDITVTISY